MAKNSSLFRTVGGQQMLPLYEAQHSANLINLIKLINLNVPADTSVFSAVRRAILFANLWVGPHPHPCYNILGTCSTDCPCRTWST